MVSYYVQTEKDGIPVGYDGTHITNEAVKTGSIKLIKYLFSKNKHFSWHTCSVAVMYDHFDLLKFLHKSFTGNFRNDDIYLHTKNTGDYDYDDNRYYTERAINNCRSAIKNNNYKMFRYVYNDNAKDSTDVIDAICEFIKDDELFYKFLNFALKKKCPFSQQTYSVLIKHHNVEKFKYLRNYYQKHVSNNIDHNGGDWDDTCIRTACYEGNLEFIKYFKKNGFTFGYNQCAETINGTHLHCLDYLLSICDLDEHYKSMMIECTISLGNLQVLKYLLEKGYTISHNAIRLNIATYIQTYIIMTTN